MKKYFFLAVFALGAMTMTSCKKQECCKLLTTKVCEDDTPDGHNWDDYKHSLDSQGYNCD